MELLVSIYSNGGVLLTCGGKIEEGQVGGRGGPGLYLFTVSRDCHLSVYFGDAGASLQYSLLVSCDASSTGRTFAVIN